MVKKKNVGKKKGMKSLDKRSRKGAGREEGKNNKGGTKTNIKQKIQKINILCSNY